MISSKSFLTVIAHLVISEKPGYRPYDGRRVQGIGQDNRPLVDASVVIQPGCLIDGYGTKSIQVKSYLQVCPCLMIQTCNDAEISRANYYVAEIRIEH